MWPVFESNIPIPHHAAAGLVDEEEPFEVPSNSTAAVLDEVEVEVEQVPFCVICSDYGNEDGTDLLLCDGHGCDRAFHRACVARRPVVGPSGEWTCPSCDPEGRWARVRWRGSDEHSMPLGVGTALLALDKKGGWGHARVLNVRVTIDIDSSSSQDSGMQDPIVPASWPAATTGSTSAVYVKFRGFAEKHNAWIEVGKGRLRPTELGVPSPDEEIYDVERVVDMREPRPGEFEYLTAWVGYEERTWEAAANFCGREMNPAIQEFRRSLGLDGGVGGGMAADGAAGGWERGEPWDHGSMRREGDEDRRATFSFPPAVSLPRAAALPASGSWIFMHSNHPAADRPMDFLPLLGYDGGMAADEMAGVGHDERMDGTGDETGGESGDGMGEESGEKTGDEMGGDTGRAGLTWGGGAGGGRGTEAVGGAGDEMYVGDEAHRDEADVRDDEMDEPWAYDAGDDVSGFGSGGSESGSCGGEARSPGMPNGGDAYGGAGEGRAAASAGGGRARAAPRLGDCRRLGDRMSRESGEKQVSPGSACGDAEPSMRLLFCRRCLTYDCQKHAHDQPLPRWRYAHPQPAAAGQPSTASPEQPASPRGEACSCAVHGRPPLRRMGADAPGETLASFPAPRRTLSAKRVLITMDLRLKKNKTNPAEGGMRVFPTAGCSHAGPCDSSNPECSCIGHVNFCEAFCGCGPLCRNRWKGCKCRKDCRTAACACWVANRECDPDVCLCAARLAGRASCDECMGAGEARRAGAAVGGFGSRPKGLQPGSVRRRGTSRATGGGEGECAPCEDVGDGLLGGQGEAPPECQAECLNMGVGLRRTQPLLLGPSQVAGWGLFAHQSIQPREFVCEYVGELVSQEEAERRGRVYDARACSYLFNLNQTQVIDAHSKGNLARFANHSDHANCDSRIVSIRGDQHIALYAKTSIRRGEEILFNYRYGSEQRQLHGFAPAAPGFKRSDARRKGDGKRRPRPRPPPGPADRLRASWRVPARTAEASSAASSSASAYAPRT